MTQPTKESELRARRRQRSLVIQISLVLIVLALMWFSFGQNVLKGTSENGLPRSFAGLKLVSTIEGSEALSQINQMHGTTIDLASAYIAEYAGDGRQMTVWVSNARNEEDAAALIRAMVNGIADGNPTFSNLKRLTVTRGYINYDVFQVDGPGGSKHFFYLSGENHNGIIWVATTGDNIRSIIEEAIHTF